MSHLTAIERNEKILAIQRNFFARCDVKCIMQDAPSNPSAIDAAASPALLPDDVGACHSLIFELSRSLAAAQESRTKLGQEVDELNAYLQRLLQQLYGRRSERAAVDPRQQAIDFGDEPAAHDALAEAAAQA